MVGNLAKHSKYFFTEFSKYKVISAVSNCLHKSSNYERTIKNIVYAIGNVSFYSDKFYSEIYQLVPHFAACLDIEIDHVIENTISTLSNLVRHSDVYVKDIIKSGVMKRVLEFVEKKGPKIMSLSVNFLLKAVQHQDIVVNYKEGISRAIRTVKSNDAELGKKILKIK